ncbi:MAG: ATPase componens of transporter with duplicated ATPase domain [Phycisphaerales bacterium]|nr:ATPase componens of transporter with duplicated ATPase domain [Phycisphaerales bacterium]
MPDDETEKRAPTPSSPFRRPAFGLRHLGFAILPRLYRPARIAYRLPVSVVTLNQIEKTLGSRTLFDKLDLNVELGERVGMVGPNGAGKTTLLRIITNAFEVDAGLVALAKGTRVGYLTQDPVFNDANTVIDEAELAFGALHVLAHQMRDLEHQMEHAGDGLDAVLAKYQDTLHDFELAGGYAWRNKLEAALLGVGLGQEHWEKAVGSLSGGQKSRLALAKILIAEPDLLLLDEPTNHLDLAAIEWLENYLLGFPGAVLLISHDRYLLDRLATRIVNLVRGKLKSYPGNYSSFLQQKELEELSQKRAYEEQQADIEKQKEFIRRFGAGQRSKEAKGREKRLNRLLISDQMVTAVDQQKSVSLKLSTEQRAGDQVLQIRELAKGYGGTTLWDVEKIDVKRGERIGIIGPNGSGKTTMLKVLLGDEPADAGTLRWGANLNIGYYDQRLGMDEFDPENTVLEEVLGDRPLTEQQLRNTLGSMMFSGDDAVKRVGVLSGGERARVRLAQLLLDKPNVLVLDEPTNHLDIATCEALEQTLRDFPGTIVCVSHDRYFLDHACTRLFVIDPPAVVDFDGRYSEWASKHAAAEQQRKRDAKQQKADPKGKQDARGKSDSRQPQNQAKVEPKPATSAGKKPADRRNDNPYARPFGRLTVKELEAQITDTEVALAECQQSFATPAVSRDPSRLKRARADADALAKKLKGLEEEFYSRET